jgi:hypothetical protein
MAAYFGSLTASLRNPPVSRVTVCGTTLYIGGTFLVSVVLMWRAPKIIFLVLAIFIRPTPMIIGIGYIKPANTNNITL